METTGKTAILLGATGLVGGTLLQLLLEDDRYSRVVLFSRRPVGFKHPKLQEEVCNILELHNEKQHFKADEVYCCVGTTNAKTPDKAQYRKVDYGIPVTTATLCVDNKVPILLVVSALGAAASSSIFYNRVKGEMEDEVLSMGVPKTHIVQPSMIGGDRKEKRPTEFFFKKLMSAFSFILLGPLKKYRVIHPKEIAKAMVWLANNTSNKQRIESEELKTLAQYEHTRN